MNFSTAKTNVVLKCVSGSSMFECMTETDSGPALLLFIKIDPFVYHIYIQLYCEVLLLFNGF